MNVYRIDLAGEYGLYVMAESFESALHKVLAEKDEKIIRSITSYGPVLVANVEPAQPTIEKATPKQIKDSVKPDGLVSFEDGKTYKSLKRHLTRRGLTPDEYRAKWGLPADYAMVSEEYSARRSELAKASGLGRK